MQNKNLNLNDHIDILAITSIIAAMEDHDFFLRLIIMISDFQPIDNIVDHYYTSLKANQRPKFINFVKQCKQKGFFQPAPQEKEEQVSTNVFSLEP